MEEREVFLYAQDFSKEDNDRKEAEYKVDRLAKHYMENTKDFPTYRDALEAVMRRHPKLAAGYLGLRVIATADAVDGSLEDQK